ncbi:Malectin-like domain [Dillenia turbinata]|uniref:Malectin-like domain n=1 Tax=Dillenia turbinata TaxID=194707 RepID=A0AAN8WDV9_9MAGN
MTILTTLRFFPDEKSRKYCYVIPVVKGGKYLVRTTYYYGDFDGKKEPPVFDQIIDGTKWSTVNTTEDFAKGSSSYYEIIVVTPGKQMSVCLARNEHTVSSPFISGLEVETLEDSMYNSTDFEKSALISVARNSFGNTNGDIITIVKKWFMNGLGSVGVVKGLDVSVITTKEGKRSLANAYLA